MICAEERRVFKACFCSGSARGFFGLLCVWLFGCLDTRPRRPCVCISLRSLSAEYPMWWLVVVLGSQQKRRCSNKLRYVTPPHLTTHAAHTADSLWIYALCSLAFSLLFCFLHSNVGQCQWSGVAQWRGSGVECRGGGGGGGGTRSWVSGVASCAFVTNPSQLSSAHNVLSRPICLLTCQYANAKDNYN